MCLDFDDSGECIHMKQSLYDRASFGLQRKRAVGLSLAGCAACAAYLAVIGVPLTTAIIGPLALFVFIDWVWSGTRRR